MRGWNEREGLDAILALCDLADAYIARADKAEAALAASGTDDATGDAKIDAVFDKIRATHIANTERAVARAEAAEAEVARLRGTEPTREQIAKVIAEECDGWGDFALPVVEGGPSEFQREEYCKVADAVLALFRAPSEVKPRPTCSVCGALGAINCSIPNCPGVIA